MVYKHEEISLQKTQQFTSISKQFIQFLALNLDYSVSYTLLSKVFSDTFYLYFCVFKPRKLMTFILFMFYPIGKPGLSFPPFKCILLPQSFYFLCREKWEQSFMPCHLSALKHCQTSTSKLLQIFSFVTKPSCAKLLPTHTTVQFLKCAFITEERLTLVIPQIISASINFLQYMGNTFRQSVEWKRIHY